MGENSFGFIILLLGTAALPLVAVTMTSFAKIAIVIFIVRNALGIQQLPPNIILYGLALILSVYIATPLINEAYAAVERIDYQLTTFEDYQQLGAAVAEPLRAFLLRHTDPQQTQFFFNTTTNIWGERYAQTADPEAFTIIVPSFLISELTKAFKIGFLLYLPFVAIDIVVTTILVALGMMMVPPTTISIPFKLMLFVFLDGWTKLVQGLVLSYA